MRIRMIQRGGRNNQGMINWIINLLKCRINCWSDKLSHKDKIIRMCNNRFPIFLLMLKFRRINYLLLLLTYKINEINQQPCLRSYWSRNRDSIMLNRNIIVKNRNLNWRNFNIWNLRNRDSMPTIDIRIWINRESILIRI